MKTNSNYYTANPLSWSWNLILSISNLWKMARDQEGGQTLKNDQHFQIQCCIFWFPYNSQQHSNSIKLCHASFIMCKSGIISILTTLQAYNQNNTPFNLFLNTKTLLFWYFHVYSASKDGMFSLFHLQHFPWLLHPDLSLFAAKSSIRWTFYCLKTSLSWAFWQEVFLYTEYRI